MKLVSSPSMRKQYYVTINMLGEWGSMQMTISEGSTTTTTTFIGMTIQAHTVLQKLFLRIKITSWGNNVALIMICHEHQNKLKYELYIDKVIRVVHRFINQTVYR